MPADDECRPIYAGNALETVQCSADALQMLTVRTTAFEQAGTSGSSAPAESVQPEVLAAVQVISTYVSTCCPSHPDLALKTAQCGNNRHHLQLGNQ